MIGETVKAVTTISQRTAIISGTSRRAAPASINIYADESHNSSYYFLSLVYTSPSHQEFWAAEMKECLNKHGIREMHGQQIGRDGRYCRCALSILTRLKMQWKSGRHSDHPLGFCVLGIKRNTLNERKYFGSTERESNMHRRFLRASIQYSLKKFYDLSKENQLSLFHLYHDQNPNLEKNSLLISSWMLDTIIRDCNYCLDSFCKQIEFISSSAEKSGQEASYLIQIADLFAWLIQRGSRDATPNSDYDLQRLLHFWKTEFLPILLLDRQALYFDRTIDPTIKSELFRKNKTCHLSFFPDEKGLCYKPKAEDFHY